MNRLRIEEWIVKVTHGNKYQFGLPDLFAAHKRYGTRWIEIKTEIGYRITSAQFHTFKAFSSKNIGVWCLNTSDDIFKLHYAANWYSYIRQTNYGIEKTPPKSSIGPERDIQDQIVEYLTKEGWYVKETYGSIYQHGLPDLYACHSEYRGRWIEIKAPYRTRPFFTPAQRKFFHELSSVDVGIWVIQGLHEINKILEPPNWWQYL